MKPIEKYVIIPNEPANDDRVHIAAEWVRSDLSTKMYTCRDDIKILYRELAQQGKYKQ